MKSLTQLLVFCWVLCAAAFVPASRGVVPAATRPASSAIVVFAKGGKPEETPGVDYGQVVVQLVNPLNPYSWFFYFFAGINLYSLTQQ